MAPIIDLYYLNISPPCRAVLLTAKAVGIKLNLKPINIMEGEQLKPEFVELNPQHTLPTMNDNGLVVWESRPIMTYLVDMYAANDSLYPKDSAQRVVVDQRLYFDMGTLFLRLYEYFSPVMFKNEAPDENKKVRVNEALKYLDIFLETNDWVAGFGMTVADIAIVVSVSTAEVIGFDISEFNNVNEWYERAKKAMAEFDYEEINQNAANTFGGFWRSKLP